MIPLRIALTLALVQALSCQTPSVSYGEDVQPVLAEKCFPCHGPDSASRKAGLRLDLAESATGPLKKGKGKALVPGRLDESVAWRRITSPDPEQRMPPPESKLTLDAAEVRTLRAWIEAGAHYEPHWAFQPVPEVVAVPSVRDTKWPRGPLDRFVLARLEREGLHPSPEATRERWLRRVTYDLIGLPPTPEEIAAFRADTADGAFERVADRLLASPHFGERMAVPWLDAARYADSYGYQSDQLCPTWPFRDWVVRAFNAGMPWDRFLTLQLAGDLVPDADRDSRLATAFQRLHRQTNEGGSIEEEFRIEYAADRVQTLGNAVLALSLECARCHDHKFDPITQRDYYALMAFLNSIDEWGLYNDSAHVPTPTLLLPTPEQEKAIAAAERERARCAQQVTELATERRAAFREWLASAVAPETLPGCVGAWSLDAIAAKGHALANRVVEKNAGRTGAGNRVVPTAHGGGIRCSGDDPVVVPSALGAVPPWQPFTVAFEVQRPDRLRDAIVFHRSSGTDTGFHGVECTLEGGRLRVAFVRFWPGNAIAVRTRQVLPADRVVHVAVTNDGSAHAAGLAVFFDGERVPVEIVRDALTKSPGNGGSGLDFAERFRSTGLEGAVLDEIVVHDRVLADVEIAQLHDGHALRDAFAARDELRLFAYWLAAVDGQSATARRALQDATKAMFAARDPVLETMVMDELPAARPTWVLARGRYDAERTPDRRVERGTPAALPPFPSELPRDRLGLARWLTDPRHPLTARSAVNRFWHQLFGRGLVEPIDNLGLRGARPSHRELLDWLAREFVASGWDTKRLLRTIVTSATYRQDSVASTEARNRDPENRLLARGPSRKLGAEMIRDTALFASGLLVPRLGGPPVSPYQPGDLWREANAMSPAYQQGKGEALHRRSLYTVWKRTAPMPNMTAFGAPSREVCTVQRASTTTPQQALVLLNDPQFVEAARVLAERTLHEETADAARVERMFVRLAGRAPVPEEARVLLELQRRQQATFASGGAEALRWLTLGERKPDPALDPATLAAWTVVAQAILNLEAVSQQR